MPMIHQREQCKYNDIQFNLSSKNVIFKDSLYCLKISTLRNCDEFWEPLNQLLHINITTCGRLKILMIGHTCS